MNVDAETIMTELEVRLLAPGGASERDILLQRLAAIATRLNRTMAAGLPRETYATWRNACDAVQAAQSTLRSLQLESQSAARPEGHGWQR